MKALPISWSGLCLALLVSSAGRAADFAKAPGAWSQATTLARIQSKWMVDAAFQRFLTTQDPDELLGVFNSNETCSMVAVAMEVGVKTILQARDQKNKVIPILEKNLDLCMQAFRTTDRGHTVYQVIFTVRRTRFSNPPPVPPAPNPEPFGPGGLMP